MMSLALKASCKRYTLFLWYKHSYERQLKLYMSNVSMILRGKRSCMLDGSRGAIKRIAFNLGLVMDIYCLIVELLHHTAFSLEKLFLCKLNCMTVLGYTIPWPLYLFCFVIHAQPFIVHYSADMAGLFSVLLWKFSKFRTSKSETLPQGSRS